MTTSDPCADCGVRDQALCGTLTDEELESLNRLGRRRHVGKGETIAWAGDDNLVCANLLSGVLKLTAATADGREQIVGLVYPADFVGRPFADRVDYDITAMTDAELCVFPREPFERALDDLNGSLHAGAEPAGLGEDNTNHAATLHGGREPKDHKVRGYWTGAVRI